MEYTQQSNRVDLRWNFSRTFEPGTVPDMPAYFRGKMYRPFGVSVTITISVPGSAVADLTIQSLAKNGVVPVVSTITVHCLSILKSGQSGTREHSESIYRHSEKPDWVQAIIDTELLSVLNNG